MAGWLDTILMRPKNNNNFKKERIVFNFLTGG